MRLRPNELARMTRFKSCSIQIMLIKSKKALSYFFLKIKK